jgi:cobyrinic acid a,c-diamide synthase
MKAQFLIAAPTSGSGKTTIARGLIIQLNDYNPIEILKAYKNQ